MQPVGPARARASGGSGVPSHFHSPELHRKGAWSRAFGPSSSAGAGLGWPPGQQVCLVHSQGPHSEGLSDPPAVHLWSRYHSIQLAECPGEAPRPAPAPAAWREALDLACPSPHPASLPPSGDPAPACTLLWVLPPRALPAPRGHRLSMAPACPDWLPPVRQDGHHWILVPCLLLGHGRRKLWPLAQESLACRPLRLVVPGPGWGAWGLLSLCQEERRKTTLFTEKARPLMLASSLPGGTEALCWENRKRGFPGPASHPPAAPPCPASAGPQLPACPSTCLYVPLTWRPRLPALGKAPRPHSGVPWRLLSPQCPLSTRDKHQRSAR